tara:strand:+ start:181 stop:915 length:735 start_codon:yes stop_codon:yes gene_type:complete
LGILLNCDLGESFGAWEIGADQRAMIFVDQVNIACGFHAGDPNTMKNTLLAAKEAGVSIGAHPSYPDLVGFGRRSMKIEIPELMSLLQYQIAALCGMAKNVGLRVEYVKPHGALYNDMMASVTVRNAVMRAISEINEPLALMLQATPSWQIHEQEAENFKINIIFEAFADRSYEDCGALVSRSKTEAILDRGQILTQVSQICQCGSITSINKKILHLKIDSICIHGDNPESINVLPELRQILDQ